MMGYNPGSCISQSFVDINFWLTIIDYGIDKFMCDKGVRPIMSGVVSKWFREEIGLPPLRLSVIFSKIGFMLKSRIIFSGIIIFIIIFVTVAVIKREPSLKLNISVMGQPKCMIFFSVQIL